MAISPYVARLRTLIGQDLLILPSVTVLVENERSELMLVRHVGFDRWGTCGGMVEPEEHPRDAAVREVKEETGLDVELTSLLTVAGGPQFSVTYPNGDRTSYVTSVFSASLTGGSEALDTEELSAIGWFDPSTLPQLELDPFATALFADLAGSNSRHGHERPASVATMAAGYSGTPLTKKLGIKETNVVAIINEPPDFRDLLAPLPPGVMFRDSLRGSADIVIAFFTERSKLKARLPALARAIYPDACLWLAWPKKTSGVQTDITGNDIRELGLAAGVVDIKVCAIDETWSGHRFAHRLKNR